MNLNSLLFSFLISSFAFAICNQLELDKNLQATGFKHRSNSALTWFKYHHSASDVITVTNRDTQINAKFSYGPLSKDLVDEEVEVWLDTCSDKLILLGTFKTDFDGRIQPIFNTPQIPSAEGTYKIWARVTGDNSFVNFTLRVLRPGAKLVIFDIDGTLTYSNLNQNIRPAAVDLTHALHHSGLEIVYLTGRHYFLTNYSRRLLKENKFAEGSLIVGQSIGDIVPTLGHVGEFKTHYLHFLKDLKLTLDQAYGNELTDIFAYQNAGIPNDRIFITGQHGGEQNTVALGEDYYQRLDELGAGFPSPLAGEGDFALAKSGEG